MKTIEVVAAIIKDKNTFFASQRGYGQFKGLWEFPGGKVEKNETKEEALIREIEEELGVIINIERYLTTIEHGYENFHLIMHCYICCIESGKIKLLEHDDSKWLLKEELDKINWIEADIKVVEELKKI